MKILPAVRARLRSLKPGPGKKGPQVSVVAAAALSLLAVVVVFILGEAYISRVALTADERSMLLPTLLLCDVLIFGISLSVTAILWYLSSLNYGNRKDLLSTGALPLYGALMLLPIVFVASDLAFKPLLFAPMEAEAALALSAIGIVALVPYFITLLEQARPRGILAGLIEDIEAEFKRAGREGTVEPAALQRPVLRGPAGTRLASLLDKLCRAGDPEPVL